jgi:hypothetical protein
VVEIVPKWDVVGPKKVSFCRRERDRLDER